MSHAAAAVPYEIIAVSGRPAPGTAPGVVFDTFQAITVSDTGVIGFAGEVTGVDVTTGNDAIVYAGAPSSIQLVARDGSPAPGTPAGVVYGSLSPPTMNDLGQLAFGASLEGTGVNSANFLALYAGPIAAPQLVGRQGNQAPGTAAGVTYSQFFVPAMNDLGQVAYLTFLGGTATSANNRAIFAGNPSSPQLIVRSGTPATGLGTGVNFFGLAGPTINDAGQIAYRVSVTGTGVTSTNDLTLYAGTFATQQLVARENSQVPGAPAGVLYSGLSVPALNDVGQIAYQADLRGAVTAASDAALFAGPMTAPVMIAREGNQAAGFAAGVTYESFRSYPGLNDNGRVSFTAILTGSGVTADNKEALYTGTYAAPLPIVRGGDLIPGSTSLRYATFSFDSPALNNVGQIAYTATLAGAGVDLSNDDGLFAFDPVLGNQLVVREGDLFNVGGNDFRTIAADGIGFISGRSDDVLNGFSNDGTIAFKLTFTDESSGVFTALIRLPGDANGDRRVNFDDLVPLAQNYNHAGTQRMGDFTNDGVVNFDDLVILAQRYNTGPSVVLPGNLAADGALAQALVPEPTMIAFAALLIPLSRRERGSL